MPPVIQIYTVQTADEAIAIAGLGVERIGVTPAARGLPGEVSDAQAASIVEALEGRAVRSALTVETDPDAISAMVETVRPDVLHLSGPTRGLSLDQIRSLRSRHPGIEIMVAIAVSDETAIAEAVEYAVVADTIILDSVTSAVEGIGAAGTVHDWAISRQIVDAVGVPVVLAGGLSAQNVAAAVAAVRPWAVDSLTHTNRPLPGGGFRKDLDAIAAFVAAARGSE